MEKIPFYANTDDDTHCVQACFKMMLGYFLPEQEFSFKELDVLTHKVEGKGTWWFPALAEFNKMGIQSKVIELFDYQKYFLEGKTYLLAFYGPEIAQNKLIHTNLKEVKHLIPGFMNGSDYENRSATIKDIDNLLDDGWLVGPEINLGVLNGSPGMGSHMVLVFAKDSQNYTLHDPGLPPHASRIVSKKLLEKAMQYAGQSNTAAVAFKH
jgi:hypothetical protein